MLALAFSIIQHQRATKVAVVQDILDSIIWVLSLIVHGRAIFWMRWHVPLPSFAFLTSTPSDNHPKTYWLHTGWAPLMGRLLWDSTLDQCGGSFGKTFSYMLKVVHWNELARNKPYSCWICLHLISAVFSFLQFFRSFQRRQDLICIC